MGSGRAADLAATNPREGMLMELSIFITLLIAMAAGGDASRALEGVRMLELERDRARELELALARERERGGRGLNF